MHVTSATFVKSATRPAEYPPARLPEIAFIGRSNVGKSSLINVLVNRKGLVRTSRTPGRTQLINFFDVDGVLSLVDLPGYGFAKVPVAVKQGWGPMIRTYLGGRPTLKGVVLLLDARRTPSGDDLEMLDWLEEYGVPTIPVITKIDKLGRSHWAARRKEIAVETGLPAELFTLFSALSRSGREEVWERIEEALAAAGGEAAPGD